MIQVGGRAPLLAVPVALGFFFLLLWFYTSNVYLTRFFDHGAIVVAYQFARIAFIPYLVWLQYAVGTFVLRGQRGRFIPCFLMGTSLWHIVLFVVGLCGLYRYPLMLAMAGGVMLASLPHMARLIAGFRIPTLNSSEKILALCAAAAALAFLLIKGTYPSGGHDFYNIYFPYYQAVLRDGSLGPNEVWYQYFYAKGMGLTFLSMILLDPLAIHLVSASFIFAAGCMVFDLLSKTGRDKSLPLFGVFLYFALYIYTPGIGFFSFAGGWGDLEKTHEVVAVLLLGIVWSLCKLFEGVHLKPMTAILCVTCITVVVITFHMGFAIGLLLVCAAGYAFRCYKHAFLPLLIAACATGLAILAILAVNYVHTGLLLDQWVIPTWSMLDWQKIVKNGTTLEIHLMWNIFGHLSPKPFSLREFLFMNSSVFRLYLFWPLICAGLLLVACRNQKIPAPGILATLLALLFGVTFIASFLSLGQPLSFFRITTFLYAPVLIGCLMLWRLADEKHMRLAIIAAIVLLPFPVLLRPQARADWQSLIRAAYAFNTGSYSLFDATNDLEGRHKDLASNTLLRGTHPAFAEIYKTLPYKTRIWNMGNIAYCMLPACKTEQPTSMITSKRWYDLPSSSIAKGRAILQAEGLNYIFYSRDILNVPFADAKDVLVALYPGLHPDHIRDVFGVKWSNGVDYLLTWKGNDTKPLNDIFMASWNDYFRQSVALRQDYFSVVALAPYIRKSARQPDLKHPLPLQ
jgi:hypothetical protein